MQLSLAKALCTPFRALVVLLATALTPIASAQLLFSHGYSVWDSSFSGSYVHFGDGSYDRSNETVAGQIQQYGEPFDFYRAFVVVDVPKFKGIVTPAQVGIPPNELDPSITELRVNVTEAELKVPAFGLQQTWYIDLPVDVRLTTLASQPLLDGAINAQAAFNALGAGTLLSSAVLSPNMASGDGVTFNLSNAFSQFLNQTDGGPLVLSFTMPFIRDSKIDNIERVFFDTPMSLVTHFDGYTADTPPFSAVPEPSTYALGLTLLCGAAVAWRRQRAPL